MSSRNDQFDFVTQQLPQSFIGGDAKLINAKSYPMKANLVLSFDLNN